MHPRESLAALPFTARSIGCCRAALGLAMLCLVALVSPALAEQVTLLGHHGKYVVAESDGRANANREHANTWETFTLIRHSDGRVSLRSHHGKYLVAEADGAANANRAHMNDWEKWHLITHGGGKVSLRGHHGKYLVAESDGRLNANRAHASTWETFRMRTVGGAPAPPPSPRPQAPAGDFPFFDEAGKPGDTMTSNGGPASWLTQATADWMRRLPDATSLAHISIPGTHDSGARHGGAACETQSWSIRQQLDAGVRYLDIRNRRTKTSFAIHHGPCFQKIMFGDVMNQVGAFLSAHPGETILMRVKEEHDAESGSQSFATIWAGYMQRYGHLFAGDLGDRMPTLGQVRGKVVVLRNADFSGYGMPMFGNSRTDIQDSYKVYWLAHDNPFGAGTVSLPQKKRLVGQYIDRAASGDELTLNHLSGAVGMIPKDVARATNAAAYDKLGPYSGAKRVGVLLMDYPGDRLIYRIIKTNFRSSTVCAARTWRTVSDASWAEFRMPQSAAGTTITIRDGAYNKYRFPKCNRVTWTDLRFTCNANGQWSHTGSWDADGLCHDSNTRQPHLAVGNR